jgi:hypothetical protein
VAGVVPEALRKKARAHLRAEEAWRKAAQEWEAAIPPMADDALFWQFMDFYREECAERIGSRGEAEAPHYAADELCRQALTGEGGYTLDEVAAFLVRWERLSSDIGNALDDAFPDGVGRTDDPFGDFCEALPMAGAEVVRKILAREYRLVEALEADVAVAVAKVGPDEASLADFICEGEGFHHMMIADALREKLACALAQDEEGP